MSDVEKKVGRTLIGTLGGSQKNGPEKSRFGGNLSFKSDKWFGEYGSSNQEE